MSEFAQQACGIIAKDMHQRLTLVSLDIQNAFNSVPFNAIENTLQRLMIPKNIADYILLML